jgi:flagellum-specific ATP synthase
MRLYAGLPQPLEMQGTLVRVTGLVLEAAGVRAPVGAVCSVGAAASRRSTPRWSASTATAPT